MRWFLNLNNTCLVYRYKHIGVTNIIFKDFTKSIWGSGLRNCCKLIIEFRKRYKPKKKSNIWWVVKLSEYFNLFEQLQLNCQLISLRHLPFSRDYSKKSWRRCGRGSIGLLHKETKFKKIHEIWFCFLRLVWKRKRLAVCLVTLNYKVIHSTNWCHDVVSYWTTLGISKTGCWKIFLSKENERHIHFNC